MGWGGRWRYGDKRCNDERWKWIRYIEENKEDKKRYESCGNEREEKINERNKRLRGGGLWVYEKEVRYERDYKYSRERDIGKKEEEWSGD